jgi:hypothetical protein
VARLLPPESSAIDLVSREVGISVATLERWPADALANGSGAGSPRWTAAARLQAVIVTATMDEATPSAWCREQGPYPTELDTWKWDAIASRERHYRKLVADGSPARRPGASLRVDPWALFGLGWKMNKPSFNVQAISLQPPQKLIRRFVSVLVYWVYFVAGLQVGYMAT